MSFLNIRALTDTFLILTIFALALTWLINFALHKNFKRKLKKVFDDVIETVFEFNHNGVHITQRVKYSDNDTVTTIKHTIVWRFLRRNKITNIVETDTHYFAIKKSALVWLIPKYAIALGDCEDFSLFLKERAKVSYAKVPYKNIKMRGF